MIASFNRFEIELPDDCVADCSHQGDCDSDVRHWADKLELDAKPADIRAELKESGAWDAEELSDNEANKQRIIWIAACNIKEESRNETTT